MPNENLGFESRLLLLEKDCVICILDYQFRIRLSPTKIPKWYIYIYINSSLSISSFLYYKRWLIEVYKLLIKIKVSSKLARWEQWLTIRWFTLSVDRVSVLVIVRSSLVLTHLSQKSILLSVLYHRGFLHYYWSWVKLDFVSEYFHNWRVLW